MMTLMLAQVIGAIPLSASGGEPPTPPVQSSQLVTDTGDFITDDSGNKITTGD